MLTEDQILKLRSMIKSMALIDQEVIQLKFMLHEFRLDLIKNGTN